jgi:hypothetical protein
MLTVMSLDSPSLEGAQKIVGGYVEMQTLPNGDQLLIDEDGRMKALDYNPEASELFGGLIVGPALLLKGKARWK